MKKMLYILISLQVLLQFTQSQIVDSLFTNSQYCPNSQKQTLSWGFNSQPQQTYLKGINYYDEPTGDSAPLRLVRNSSSVNFQVIFYDRYFLTSVYVDAANSADNATFTFTLNGLLNSYLVLERKTISSGNIDYIGYRFDPYSFLPVAGYVLTMNPGPPYEAFTLFSSFQDAKQKKCIIGVKKMTNRGIAQYILTVIWSPPFTGSSNTRQNRINFNSQIVLDEFRGNQNVLLNRDAANKQIIIYKILTNNTYGQIGQVMPFNINSNTDLILKTYALKRGVTIVSMVDQTGKKGWLVPIKLSADYTPWRVDLAVSTMVLREFSDEVQNYMSIGSNQIYWYNLVYNDVNTSARIPTSELSTIDLLSVALSGNVGAFLYGSKVEYYRIQPIGNSVSKIFSKSFTSSDMTLTGTSRWRIALNCMCSKMSIGCFGETFLCVVKRAALSSCF